MSEHSSENDQADQDGPMSVPDEELPEDLQPSEDNPLAQPAGDDVPEDVLKDTSSGSGGGPEDADPGEEASSEAD